MSATAFGVAARIAVLGSAIMRRRRQRQGQAASRRGRRLGVVPLPPPSGVLLHSPLFGKRRRIIVIFCSCRPQLFVIVPIIPTLSVGINVGLNDTHNLPTFAIQSPVSKGWDVG